jgi:diaminopropionate ammonia-lyase
VLSVEPQNAAGVLASVRAGYLSSVETGRTVMAGLNCETPSSLAWPLIEQGLDACVAVADTAAILAMADLEGHGVLAGPSGAAALAGARAVLGVPERRAALGITPASSVLLVCTEGRASGAV